MLVTKHPPPPFKGRKVYFGPWLPRVQSMGRQLIPTQKQHGGRGIVAQPIEARKQSEKPSSKSQLSLADMKDTTISSALSHCLNVLK